MQLEETDNVQVIGSDEVYIGSMDSDDYQTASFRINVDADTESVTVDTLDMPIALEYTDSGGEQSETQTVQTELYTQQELQQYGLASGGSIVPLVVVVLLAVGGGLYYWRRRKKE
jgi:LPXTG-motif cell wall-anchored protein